MASYLQIENISKSYGEKVLFSRIGFNINEGDKIALIAPNGTGKTSLLKILAGLDRSDSGGKITFLKDIRIAFLSQEYAFDPDLTIGEQVARSAAWFLRGLDDEGRAEYDLNLRKLLTGFNLPSLDAKMGTLSGGEVKRVAIAEVLATDSDFLIFDEPTNHLDLTAIEFLEGWLSHKRCTLLMVTHDRYFLERVCNTIFELDHGQLFIYRGDYENYLEKRAERIDNYNAETDKVRNILRRELEWMRATPCARTGKAKYRKDAFYQLKERSEQVYTQRVLDMSDMSSGSRLGTKIFDCKHLSFHYGTDCYLDDFTYNFARGERVGIVGENGAGKSTFMDMLFAGTVDGGLVQAVADGDFGPDAAVSGALEVGASVRVGYYRQRGLEFDERLTVLEAINDTRLLSRFLFPHNMLNSPISTLSGGEKRRLYLLSVLKQEPNVLILDEPTNDLDIVTLNVLEEYLLEYKGTLIIVSHDRHFLDRLCDHLLVFCGDGVVKDFIGSYTAYRSYLKDYQASVRSAGSGAVVPEGAVDSRETWKGAAAKVAKPKMSYKEKREFEALEVELPKLEAEKASLETSMNSGSLGYEELQAASARYEQLCSEIDLKEFRWLELSELN